MERTAMRVLYLLFAATLFFFALVVSDSGGNRDIVKASFTIGFCAAGSIALVMAAIVKKDT